MDGDLLRIILIGIFLILSAFFSSSEAAFLSLQKTRLSYLVSNKIPGAKRISEMVNNTERLLSTILLGNNLVNVALSALITALCVDLMKDSSTLAIPVAIGIGTVLLLIFGEIIPKSIAVKNAEKTSFLFAKPLKIFETSLFPITVLLQWLSQVTQSIFGQDNEKEEGVTEGEILSLIDLGEAEGTVEATEAEMVENVFKFSDIQVKEVMTPRIEIISIEKGATLSDFLKIYQSNSHTRFPVHKENNENIIGIISTKDVLRVLSLEGINFQDSVTEIIRDAYFVPETKLASDLFEELRLTGNQMAICLDEYGGIAGLVTLKRLTEAIVGKVAEEGQSLEEEYESISHNSFQIEGGMDINDVNSQLNLNLPDGEYETIAGFVLSTLGEIPKTGDKFIFENLTFEIISMDQLRIDSILITRTSNMDQLPENQSTN